jgi:hypothetical protein
LGRIEEGARCLKRYQARSGLRLQT